MATEFHNLPLSCSPSDRVVGYLDRTPLPSAALGRLHHSKVPEVGRRVVEEGDGREVGVYYPPVWVVPEVYEYPTEEKEEEVIVQTRGEGKERVKKDRVPVEERVAEKRQCRRCLKFKAQEDMDYWTRSCAACKKYSDNRARKMKEEKLKGGEGRGRRR